MTLLFLGEHVIAAEHITCVKKAGKKTTVWVAGQSAVDGGFLVDMPFDEVMALWTGEEAEDAAEEGEEKPEG